MSDEEDKSARRRHKGFPLVPLGTAVEVVRESVKYGSDHPLTAFAQYMGYRSTNGGAFRAKIAGYRDWGLIERTGERVTITELGKRLALPVHEKQEREDLREAFLSADVFAGVHAGSAKGTPLDARALANLAVHSQGISPASVDQFARVFAESAITAGMADDVGDGRLALRDGDSPISETRDAGSKDLESAQVQPRLHPSEKARADPAAEASETHRISRTFRGGDIVLELHSVEPLPASVFVHLGRLVAQMTEMVAELDVESIGPPTSTDPALDGE